MKILKAIIILVILAAVAYVAYQVASVRIGKGELDAYELDIFEEGGKLYVAIPPHEGTAKITINYDDVVADIQNEEGATTLIFDLEHIEHNELLTFKIKFYDTEDAQIGNVQISNVCITTDGKIPKKNIKHMVLYDYTRKGFPKCETDSMVSLSMLNTGRNVHLNEIAHIVSLETLRVTGGGIGEMQSLKSMERLRRLILTGSININGELDDIDGLFLLEYVELGGTGIKGELKDFEPLDNIETLRLRANSNITGDIKWIKKLKALKVLETVNCRFTGDIEDLAQIITLTQLTIEGSAVGGDIGVLAMLENLEKLHIISNGDITGYISDLYELEPLDLVVEGCRNISE